MEAQNHGSGSYTWTIYNFKGIHQKKHYSNVFTIGGCRWRILIFPKGNNVHNFSIYLNVPDFETLPNGWYRDVTFALTVVNQNSHSQFIKKETRYQFNAQESDWGFKSFMSLRVLHDPIKGFLVNDTVIVGIELEVHSADPSVVLTVTSPPNTDPSAVKALTVTGVDGFDSFFSDIEELIVIAESSTSKGSCSSKSNNQTFDLISGSPCLEEVKEAKQSLKECLSDLFKLNMKDRLASALLTLSRAETGLSPDQQKSVKAFWENFDEFISDFLSFEQDNSKYELLKLAIDQLLSSIRKNHTTHLSNKELLESLNKEEEDMEKRLEEVKIRKRKLMSDWEGLMTVSEEMKSQYVAKEKKLAVAEEKKRIAEERMSRSTMAWSSLKAQFL
ncbi:hypothetical protein SAY87_001333 [Trapa incisa]|uniref:MATH domain-containing protein n=1 Tax=Trapa incisa TaxID=236973 RepID=A0AAN7JHA1_9MYRT|nr:hypothetical protein SAY87_001333 [Trapa incisa]